MVEKCVTGMNEFLNKPGAPQWDHHNSQRPGVKTVGNWYENIKVIVYNTLFHIGLDPAQLGLAR